MNNSTQNYTQMVIPEAILVLALIALVAIIYPRSQAGVTATSTAPSSISAFAPSSPSALSVSIPASAASASSSPIIAVHSDLGFALETASTTYNRTQEIDMVLSVINHSGITQTLSFPDGCQATYTIGTFNMLDHMVCLPNPSSFSVAPYATIQINLAYYPSVGELAPGQYTLTARIIGQPTVSVPITITQ